MLQGEVGRVRGAGECQQNADLAVWLGNAIFFWLKFGVPRGSITLELIYITNRTHSHMQKM